MSEISMTERRDWSFNILRDDKDTHWPDSRDQPWSQTGKTYRPQRVALNFHQRDGGPVELSGSTIYGPRYTKAGPVGAIVNEHGYGRPLNELWFTSLVGECRAQIAAVLGD